MLESQYWTLVENDPRDWSHDQKVLFWWVVHLLPKMSDDGVIAAPSEAPLTDAEISEVLEEILPLEGNTRVYMDEEWKYEDQTVIMPSSEGHVVMIQNGKVMVAV